MSNKSIFRYAIPTLCFAAIVGYLVTCSSPLPYEPDDNIKASVVLKNPNVTPTIGDSVVFEFSFFGKQVIDSIQINWGDSIKTTLFSSGLNQDEIKEIIHVWKTPGNFDCLPVVFATSGKLINGTKTIVTINGFPPHIEVVSATDISKTIVPGQSITCSLKVTGSDSLSYVWKKNGVQLSTSKNYAITNASNADTGMYKFFVRNNWGADSATVAVLFTASQQLPAPVISTITPGNNQVTISWNIITNAESYNVYYRQGTLVDASSPNKLSTTSNSLIVTGLTNDIQYAFTVCAVKLNGELGLLSTFSTATPHETAPVVTTEPINQSVLVGQTATFSITASGPNVQYQWQKGTSDITGATSASYTTPATAIADNGTTYRCIVSNTIGKDTSISAMLTVSSTVVAPTITKDPKDTSVAVGQTMTFIVTASGTSPQYQWQKGTGDIPGATSASYTTPVATITDNGTTYRCIVSNSARKDTSLSATLTVTLPIVAPVITTDPTNQSVVAGSTATFSVTASGTNPLYQWQKGTADISGATSASYTTPATTIGDNGTTYRCIVSNSAGKDTSLAATLSVTAQIIAPTITKDPKDTSIVEQQAITFSVSASGTNPAFQWQRWTSDISGANSATYTISAVSMADNGAKFCCIVSNTAGKDTSLSATLTVTPLVVKPVITTEPTNQSVVAGQTATFSLTATGTNPLQYQWQKGTTDLPGATAASYITPVTAIVDNGATYRCIVSNSAGKDTCVVVTLTVTAQIVAPTVTKDPKDSSVVEGQSVSFFIEANGTSPLYQWQRTFNTSTLNLGGETSAILTIATVYKSDSGATYRCIVTNTAGKDTSAYAKLTVRSLPTAPVVSGVTTGDGTATVSWGAVNGAVSYKVYYIAGSTVTKATGTVVTSTVTSKQITGLTNGTEYAFGVTAINGNGESVISNIITKTPIAAPTVSITPTTSTVCENDPVTFTASANGTGTLTYKWKKDGTVASSTTTTYSFNAISADSGATVQCIVMNANGDSGVSNSAKVIVNKLSTSPSRISVSKSTICPGDSTVLSVVGGTLGTGAVWKWDNGQTGASITVKPQTQTTYSVHAEGGACGVTTGSISTIIYLNTASVKADSIVASKNLINAGDTTTLRVVGGSLGTLATWKWYENGCGTGQSIGTGDSIMVMLTANTTYYVRAEGTCNSTACVSKQIKMTGILWTMWSNGAWTINSIFATDSNIFVGLYNAVYHSINNGVTWNRLPDFTGSPIIYSILKNGTTLFAGCTYTDYNGGGVFMSTKADTGWTAWQTVNSSLPDGTTINTLIASGGKIFAGTTNGVYSFNYDGSGWSENNLGIPSGVNVKAFYNDGSTFYAGTNAGAYKSIYQGLSWSSWSPITISETYDVRSFTVINGTLFIGTATGIYRTTNFSSWVPLIAANTDVLYVDELVSYYDKSGTANIIAGTSSRGVFYLSIDTGNNWTIVDKCTNSNITYSANALAISNKNIFGGLFRRGVMMSPLP